MATPTSVLTYNDMLSILGKRYANGAPSATTTLKFEKVIQLGYAKFLNDHDWTFMRPTLSVDLATTTETYTMPDDFAGLIGDVTINIDTQSKTIIPMTNPEYLKDLATSTSGIPSHFSLEPSGDGDTGQVWTMRLYPKVSGSNVSMTYRYERSVDLVAAGKQFLGGPAMTQAILTAASAELGRWVGGGSGDEAKRYEDELETAKRRDGQNRTGVVNPMRTYGRSSTVIPPPTYGTL